MHFLPYLASALMIRMPIRISQFQTVILEIFTDNFFALIILVLLEFNCFGIFPAGTY